MSNSLILILICLMTGCHSVGPKENPGVLQVKEDFTSFYSLAYVSMSKKETEESLKNILSKTCKGDLCKYGEVKSKEKFKVIAYQAKNLQKMQNNSWESNQKSIKRVKESQWAREFSKFAKYDQCPKNLNVAIIKKLDDNLDEANTFSILDLYYQNLITCDPLKEHELIHLRMAILYYKEKQLDKATVAIKNALLITKDEYTRINYWAGVILKDNQYFKKVVYDRPFSYHAVKAAEKLSLDLVKVLKDRPEVLERRSELAPLVESLLKHKKEKEAYTLINNNLTKFSIEEMLYWVKIFSYNKQVDYTIRLVSRSYILNPERFSFEFLEHSFHSEYKKEFEKYAELVDPYLMLSLSKQESGFNPRAQSSAKAKGLMQIIPSTARYVSKSKAKDLFNPTNNIFIGVNYFHELNQKFKKPEYALAAYNAGPRTVESWVRQYPDEEDLYFMDLIPYRETRIYVSSILRNYFFYKRLR